MSDNKLKNYIEEGRFWIQDRHWFRYWVVWPTKELVGKSHRPKPGIPIGNACTSPLDSIFVPFYHAIDWPPRTYSKHCFEEQWSSRPVDNTWPLIYLYSTLINFYSWARYLWPNHKITDKILLLYSANKIKHCSNTGCLRTSVLNIRVSEPYNRTDSNAESLVQYHMSKQCQFSSMWAVRVLLQSAFNHVKLKTYQRNWPFGRWVRRSMRLYDCHTGMNMNLSLLWMHGFLSNKTRAVVARLGLSL